MTSRTFYQARDYKFRKALLKNTHRFRKGVRIIFRASEEGFRNKLS